MAPGAWCAHRRTSRSLSWSSKARSRKRACATCSSRSTPCCARIRKSGNITRRFEPGWGTQDDTSPSPSLSPFRFGRDRTHRHSGGRHRARLPNAPGPHDRRPRRRRPDRFRCPPDRAVAVGAHGQPVRGEKPHRRRRHAGHGNGRQRDGRWIHPFVCGPDRHHQRFALQETCQRARPIIAGRPRGARPEHHGGDALAAGQNREGIHRLRQGQSGTDIVRLVGRRRASPHLSGEYFKFLAKIDMVHVPYRGSAAAYPDLMSGKVQVLFDNLGGPVLQMVHAGTLRALGVTSAERWPLLPDVPAIAETVPGYEIYVWYALFAPRGTPADIVAKLNAALKDAVADPKILARFKDDGGVPMVMTPAALAQFLADDEARWRKMVDAAGITAE